MLGESAPNFTLKNTDKSDVSLSDYKGKTVIMAFYPGAITGVCDNEMCAFQDNFGKLSNSNAAVIGISVDSPWANAEFASKNNLEFELLSDITIFTSFPKSNSFLIEKIACFKKSDLL